MKTKLNKKELKEIRQFALTIPPTFYEANAKVILTASEILDIEDENLVELQHHIKSNTDKIKLTDKFTLEKRGVLYPINHYNQLKNIYYNSNKKELIINVQKYIDGQVELYELMNKPINLHGKVW